MNNSVLVTRNLHHSFNSVKALDGVSLEVPPGTVFGFLGSNGAGKTTTICCILGLIRAQEGSVHINGHDLKFQRSLALQSIGAVVETPALYSNLTGRENLDVTRLVIGAEKN